MVTSTRQDPRGQYRSIQPLSPNQPVASEPFRVESEFEWRPLTGLDTVSAPNVRPLQHYQRRPKRLPVKENIEEVTEKVENLSKIEPRISEGSKEVTDSYPLSERFKQFYKSALNKMRFGSLFSDSVPKPLHSQSFSWTKDI